MIDDTIDLVAFVGICLGHNINMKLVFALGSHCAAPSTCICNTKHPHTVTYYNIFILVSTQEAILPDDTWCNSMTFGLFPSYSEFHLALYFSSIS